jgi:pyruvate/2-oxoacid:ferredoxin oxidoreductase alpha subunit
MGERKLLTGNHAASYGATLSRAEVISAYPITPQTSIVELLSEIVASGKLNAKFINVESEHSAMAACIGASAAGCRTYTATSGQGLALMHEMLHWAVGARTPVVLSNVTRAMAPPWSIYCEQTDFLSQRDVGWLMLFAENAQEAQDFIIWLYKVCEQIYLPGMIALDAFILSHTFEPLIVHEQAKVDAYLPKFKPLYNLDPQDPKAWGSLTNRDQYFEFRYKIYKAMENAIPILKAAGTEFKEILGFKYNVVETFMLDDADYVLISAGAMTANVRYAVKQLREQGHKVGLLKLVAFRPFPFKEIQTLLAGRKKVAILDRNMSPGHSGIFLQEIKSALFNRPNHPLLYGYVLGIGGRDIKVTDILSIYDDLITREQPLNTIYVGVKGITIGDNS